MHTNWRSVVCINEISPFCTQLTFIRNDQFISYLFSSGSALLWREISGRYVCCNVWLTWSLGMKVVCVCVCMCMCVCGESPGLLSARADKWKDFYLWFSLSILCLWQKVILNSHLSSFQGHIEFHKHCDSLAEVL